MSASYTNFPVLFHSTDMTFSTSSTRGHLFNPQGFDLVFSTLPDCSLELNYDRETRNTNGTYYLYCWVNMPIVSSITDTVFYTCYGNSSIVNNISQMNNTWDPNYIGVYHLATFLTSGGVATDDATVYSSSGAFVGEPKATNGRMDGAANFLTTTTIAILNYHVYEFAGPFTVSAWIYPTTTATYQTIVSADYIATGHRDFSYFISGLGTSNIFVNIGNGALVADIPIAPPISLNKWNYVVMTADGSNVRIYVNGVQSGGQASTAEAILEGGNVNVSISSVEQVLFPMNNCSVDEVRISTIARSAGWIQTEYANQLNPIYFLTIGPENYSVPILFSPGTGAFVFNKSSLNGRISTK